MRNAADDDRVVFECNVNGASYSFTLSNLAVMTPEQLRRVFPAGLAGGLSFAGLREVQTERRRAAFRLVKGGKR